MRTGNITKMVAEKFTVVQIVPEMDEGGVEGETLDYAVYMTTARSKVNIASMLMIWQFEV